MNRKILGLLAFLAILAISASCRTQRHTQRHGDATILARPDTRESEKQEAEKQKAEQRQIKALFDTGTDPQGRFLGCLCVGSQANGWVPYAFFLHSGRGIKVALGDRPIDHYRCVESQSAISRCGSLL